MPRTTRRKLAEGIYADNHGYAIVVHFRGRRREKRFKRSFPQRLLKSERDTLLHKLRQNTPLPGSFKADADSYLASLPDGKMKENRERECRVWYAALGKLPRGTITTAAIDTELARFDLSASSKRKALTAIKAIWKFHDGPQAPTPVDHIKRPKERHEIRGIPPAVVTMILRKLPPSKTRARLKVIARTGLPHSQVAQLLPHHLDLEKRELTVTPRRKGKGVPARTLPITRNAVRAFKEFQRVQAWGSFSHHSMWRMFQEAVEAAKATWKGRWPAAEKLRPYDLRHAFLTEAYRVTRDLRAVSELGLHADLSMTARYAAAAVSETTQAARDALEVPRAKRVAQTQITTFRPISKGRKSGQRVALRSRKTGKKR